MNTTNSDFVPLQANDEDDGDGRRQLSARNLRLLIAEGKLHAHVRREMPGFGHVTIRPKQVRVDEHHRRRMQAKDNGDNEYVPKVGPERMLFEDSTDMTTIEINANMR